MHGLWWAMAWAMLFVPCRESIAQNGSAGMRLEGEVSVVGAGALWFKARPAVAMGARERERMRAQGGVVVVLDGVEAVLGDQACELGARRWDCGARGVELLAVVIGRDRVRCVLANTQAGVFAYVVPWRFVGTGANRAQEHPGVEVVALHGRCVTDREGDLARVVVGAGFAWARYHGYFAAQRAARARGVGIWRHGGGDVAEPGRWLQGRLEAIRATVVGS